MKEYKRQKAFAEEQYASLLEKVKFHNDHLRAVDAWFAQLLDEVRLLAHQTLPHSPPPADAASGTQPSPHPRVGL